MIENLLSRGLYALHTDKRKIIPEYRIVSQNAMYKSIVGKPPQTILIHIPINAITYAKSIQ